MQRDLRDIGVDVYDEAQMKLPWQWLRDAILGLIDRPHGWAPDGYPAFTTRVQTHFYGPRIKKLREADAQRRAAEKAVRGY